MHMKIYVAYKHLPVEKKNNNNEKKYVDKIEHQEQDIRIL